MDSDTKKYMSNCSQMSSNYSQIPNQTGIEGGFSGGADAQSFYVGGKECRREEAEGE
jgi:hypothetical protein